jgi:hypothetical protein
LKSWQLDRRVGALSERMKSVESDVVRIDFDSFTEPEKQLFNRIWEIQEEYGISAPSDVIEANKELTYKALEVILRRVLELFIFAVPKAFCWDEIEEWFFKLHFFNFFRDLDECLANVRRWSEKDREEFLNDMKQSGMLGKVFRIPSRINEHKKKVKNKKKVKVND